MKTLRPIAQTCQTDRAQREYPSSPNIWRELLPTRQVQMLASFNYIVLNEHLATLFDAASPEVLSSDRHTDKPWFQGKLPFSFNIPEQSALPTDTALIGADLTYVNGRPTALLLFTIHKHHASVFVSQEQVSEFVHMSGRSGVHFSRGRGGRARTARSERCEQRRA